MPIIPDFIIGHRGAAGLAPENTVSSFQKAYDLGVKCVEFDVTLTADLHPVVIHDDSVDRTTNGHGQVRELSLSAIEKLDAGSWFSPNFAHEKIPTLAKVFDFLVKHPMQFNLELKKTSQTAVLIEQVMRVFKSFESQLKKPYFFSSFDWNHLSYLARHYPGIPLGLLMEKEIPWEKAADEIQAISIHIEQNQVTESLIKRVHQSGRLLLTYTVNDSARAYQLRQMGVDAIFTDVPDPVNDRDLRAGLR